MNRRDRRRAQRTGAPTTAVRGPTGPLGRAMAMLVEGRPAEAEEVCRRVLATDRTSTEANRLLARALREQGRLDEAMLAARRATTAAPRSATAHTELGAVLAAEDRLMEALRSFEQAIELDPEDADAHNRYGAAMLDLGQLDEALRSFRRVARLLPDHPVHHANVAVTLSAMGEHAKARRAYDRALTLLPDDARLRYNRSFARLATGDLAGGWEDQEFGFAVGERVPDRRPPVTRWDGSAIDDERILVWREQGLGDELRHASCYPELTELARDVVIECDPRLVDLFARSFPSATVRAQTYDQRRNHETENFEGIDVHCPAGSVPRFLRRSVDAFPDLRRYLVPDPALVDDWGRRLDGLGEGLKVGVCWRSMDLSTSRLRHYTTLAEWEPILTLPGVDLVNLQYGPRELRESELAEVRERLGVAVHEWDDLDYTGDLEGVAALTSQLDVVVSANTSVAVLAGALGVPVLILAPVPSAFHHGLPYDPWTPSARAFPRGWDRTWEGPITAIAAELARMGAAGGDQQA